MTAANAILLIDKLTAQWLAQESGSGDGTFGASLKQANLLPIVAALNDVQLEAILAVAVQNYPDFTGASDFKTHNLGLRSALNAAGLSSATLSSTIVDWDSLLYWYNVLAPGGDLWAALAPPDYIAAMQALGITPRALNVYFEVLTGATWQGNTFTNGLGKLVVVASVPTYTAGYTVNPANFAGGFPYLNVASIAGSGVVTVMGKNQLGGTESFTVNASAASRYPLVPGTTATDLITGTTAISAAAGITAIVATVEGNRPAGRVNPPT